MYEGFPGEVKLFFVRGLMFPNEEVFSSSWAHGEKDVLQLCPRSFDVFLQVL